MDDHLRSMLSLMYGASALTTLAIDVAFVILAATIVRRHRPDAWKPLLAWTIAVLAYTLIGTAMNVLVPLLAVRGGGADAFMTMQVIESAVGVVVHVALSILLARALIAIAQPPRTLGVDGAPPYR